MKCNTDDTRITGMIEVRDAQSLLEDIPLSEQYASSVFADQFACLHPIFFSRHGL